MSTEDERRQIQVETLMAARDAARADWRLVMGPPESKEIYDENQASHFSGMAGWLKRRADKIAAGQEPDWPDSSSAVIGPLDELTPESDAKLRARNAAIFADNQRLGEANERLVAEVALLQSERDARPALTTEAVEAAANAIRDDVTDVSDARHVAVAALRAALPHLAAADTRAEVTAAKADALEARHQQSVAVQMWAERANWAETETKACKAAALDEFAAQLDAIVDADQHEQHCELCSLTEAAVLARRRAADTRAELGDS